MVPQGALRWSLIGSSSTKLTAIKLARARGALAKPPKDKDTYFFLHGSDDTERDAPAWLFLCGGKHDVAFQQMSWGELRWTTQIELRFPSDFVWQLGPDPFVELAARFAALLPVESGFASIALSWSPLEGSISQEAPFAAAPFLLAHDGLDLFDNSPHTLGGHTRAAQWLTILGPELVNKLGGANKLALDSEVGVLSAGNATILRAGHAPDIDLSPHDRALRESVARAIRPVTLFTCDGRVRFPDETSKERWRYRFVGGKP